ncbi:hypothetical protein BS78_10G001400 [Paspalum vaginatum]|nr:hypothetical protein BS78_10G001400 [Paspalum vaginatum]
MLTLTQSWTVSAVPLSPSLDAADDGGTPPLPLRHEPLVASLHGLIVLQQRRGLYIVCNPTTRQWTNLPVLAPRPCSTAFPLWLLPPHRLRRVSPSLPRQRLLLLHRRRPWYYYYYSDDDEYGYNILSAGSAQPRRLPGRAPFPADRKPYLVGLSYGRPVAHRGVLHWLRAHSVATRTGKMLAFCTNSETFRLMSLPPTAHGEAAAAALLELDGDDGAGPLLCALAMHHGGTPLDIWVLQDYEAETWTLRHRVTPPPPPPMPCRRGDFRVSGALSAGGGTILVRGPNLSRAKAVAMKQMQLNSTPTLLTFSESLVPHDFFHQDAPRCPDLAPIKFPD